MVGLVLDIYIGFLLRLIVMQWRGVASRNWPVVSGSVVRCYFEKRDFGGDFVVLRYKYKADFERFQGEIKKPYIYPNYADAFVRHHSAGSELRVRINPKDPTRSFPLFS
jgi:hypothetical protein